MADRTTTAEAGFTLAEMLAALAILLFGVTALLGGMSASVAQRRTTDARHELVALCDHALHRVQNEAIRSTNGGGSPTDLELVPMVDQPAPGFEGMRWTAKVVADENRPELWLVRIEVRWLDAGDEVQAEFLRIVPRQLPLRDRVAAARGETTIPAEVKR
jgi:prepilin-type N-terminal cleavage/methylation domain-containing protein